MRRSRRHTRLGAVPVVELRDFELYDDRSGERVNVLGEELQECFTELALANGFAVEELLTNSSIPSHKPLPCRIAENVPRSGRWSHDEMGYLLVKLRKSCTLRGHTFLGDGGTDGAYRNTHSIAKNGVQIKEPSTPVVKRRRIGPPGWMADFSLSPGSPGDGGEGRTQPLPIRLHRSAAISISANPSAKAAQIIRHICGRKRCAVVSHFRGGTQAENSADEMFHLKHLGCSAETWSPLQG